VKGTALGQLLLQAFRTVGVAPSELDLASRSVNLGVVVHKPIMTEEHLLITEVGHCKQGTFGVVPKEQRGINYMGNCTRLVLCAIYIVDWYQLRQFDRGYSIVMDEVDIEKLEFGTGVDKGLDLVSMT
jgi:hypothetical protein